MNKRFAKGQTVYQACAHFSGFEGDEHHKETILGIVVSRVIDSCGAKKITFAERGADWVYGKSDTANSQKLFADAESAFAYLAAYPYTDVICPDVYADDNSAFDALKNGTLRIAAKAA